MSVLRRNMIANMGGNTWIGLIHLVFVPLYIRFIGIEAYGLVGFFAILLALFSLLDMGLNFTLNREMARMAPHAEKSLVMRDLLRTIEIPYWIVAVLIGITVALASPYIAYYWLNVEGLDPKRVRIVIILMGLCAALQWPLSLYSSGLMGLQRQVLLNIANIVIATLRGAGAVLILWLVSPTVEAFFLWQIAINAAHVGVIVTLLWRSLPPAHRAARFNHRLILNTWRFAGGMAVANIVYLIMTQADRVFLSKTLTLEQFGYYSLATVLVIGLTRLTSPLRMAAFPHFTQLVSLRDEIGLIRSYHKTCQFLAVASLPAAMMLIFFPSEILLLWTGNPNTTSNTYLILRLLAIAAALNGLLLIPLTLVLSHGFIKIFICVNSLAILVLLPLIYILTARYGVLGAPAALIAVNCCTLFITIHVLHSRFLKKDKWKWYMHDVLTPLTAVLAMACFWRMIIPTVMTRISILFLLIGIFIAILAATAIATSSTRFWISQTLTSSLAFIEGKRTNTKQ